MTEAQTFQALLDEHGQTFAEEAGITLTDKPAPLYQLLVLTSLLSANLSRDLGVRAAAALRREFRTAPAMAGASDDDRWRVLSEARYLRTRQTARQLGELADPAPLRRPARPRRRTRLGPPPRRRPAGRPRRHR